MSTLWGILLQKINSKTKPERTSFWFDPSLKKKIKFQALMHESSITAILDEACREWLKKHSMEIQIPK